MCNCEEIFHKQFRVGLTIFKEIFENVTGKNFNDMEPFVMKYCEFSPRYHKGPMEPMYYTRGIPSLCWVCKSKNI